MLFLTNYKLEKLVIKKTLFYDDISTSTLRAMRVLLKSRVCGEFVFKNVEVSYFQDYVYLLHLRQAKYACTYVMV